jgi:hypothetical protein
MAVQARRHLRKLLRCGQGDVGHLSVADRAINLSIHMDLVREPNVRGWKIEARWNPMHGFIKARVTNAAARGGIGFFPLRGLLNVVALLAFGMRGQVSIAGAHALSRSIVTGQTISAGGEVL